MTSRVGFIGLGRMGQPMCRHLLKAGFALTVYDVQPQAMAALVEMGARGAASARDVARQSEVVIVLVTDDAQVSQVVEELLQGAQRGAVIAICSSVHPDTCRALAQAAAQRSVGFVDAPLARGVRGAESGTLTIYFGGEPTHVEVCRPVFRAFSEQMFHMGPVGTGQITKTCNNLLHWAGVVACYESLTLGARLGVSPEQLRPALLAASGESATLRDLERVGMFWPDKDMETAVELAEASATPIPLMREVKELVKGISAQDLRALFHAG